MTIPAPWSLPLWMRRRIQRAFLVDAISMQLPDVAESVLKVGSMTVKVRMPERG